MKILSSLYQALIGAAFCVSMTTALAAEPPNLSTLKTELETYHDSGCYSEDIATVIEHAMMYMKFRLNQNARLDHPQKLALVLDIDETSLSNYKDMVNLHFGGTFSEIDALEARGDDPAIPYTRTLYQYAKTHGIAVFFVTGRHESLRAATVKNLKVAGYPDWQALYMRPDNDHRASVVPYKTAMRIRIEQQGYDIVVNVGDQNSDLDGGHADMAFKLPDPFYLIG